MLSNIQANDKLKIFDISVLFEEGMGRGAQSFFIQLTLQFDIDILHSNFKAVTFCMHTVLLINIFKRIKKRIGKNTKICFM